MIGMKLHVEIIDTPFGHEKAGLSRSLKDSIDEFRLYTPKKYDPKKKRKYAVKLTFSIRSLSISKVDLDIMVKRALVLLTLHEWWDDDKSVYYLEATKELLFTSNESFMAELYEWNLLD